MDEEVTEDRLNTSKDDRRVVEEVLVSE